MTPLPIDISWDTNARTHVSPYVCSAHNANNIIFSGYEPELSEIIVGELLKDGEQNSKCSLPRKRHKISLSFLLIEFYS